MYPPNHMLYRPIGLIVDEILNKIGYQGNPAQVLQYLTATLASIGIGFFFLALLYLTKHMLISGISAAFLAVSWSYWTFSTDVHYIVAAAMSVAIALAITLSPSPSFYSAVFIALFCALSILFWQASIFILPSLMLALLRKYRTKSLKHSFKAVGVFFATLIFLIIFAYSMVGLFSYGHRTIPEFLSWLLSHGSDIAGRPPVWGNWAIDRIPSASVSAISSIIPVWGGLGIRKLLQGIVQWNKVLPQLSLLVMIVIGAWSIAQVIIQRYQIVEHIYEFVWLFIGYVMFLPFIVWWDPYEPRWFVIPNIFLIAAIARLWSANQNIKHNQFVLSVGFLVIIGIANFTSTIWPRHTKPNPKIALAECFTANAGELDFYIPTYWDWFGYATYFFDYRGDVLTLLRGDQNREKNLERVESALSEANDRGGSVYVVDINSYPEDQRIWIMTKLGIYPEDLIQYEQSPAFMCGDQQFMQIAQQRDLHFQE